mgnify:CR=1 FL=1
MTTPTPENLARRLRRVLIRGRSRLGPRHNLFEPGIIPTRNWIKSNMNFVEIPLPSNSNNKVDFILRDRKLSSDKSNTFKVMAVQDGHVADTKINLRGDPHEHGELVSRGFLSKISPRQDLPCNDSSSGRLELAKWLTEPDHPLTARVIVNRIWYWHFGKGIVSFWRGWPTLGQGPIWTWPKFVPLGPNPKSFPGGPYGKDFLMEQTRHGHIKIHPLRS